MTARWPWFRLFTEARNDAKLDALNDREFRIWFKLLCLAAEAEPRGEVDYLDPEFVAMNLRVGVDELDSAISRMIRLRLVERSEERIVFESFGRRQYVPPSQEPEALRDRQRRHRERAKGGVVTSRDRGVTSRDVTTTEQNRDINTVGPVDTVDNLGPVTLAEILAKVNKP